MPRSARKPAPQRPRRRIRKLRLLGLLLILFVLGTLSFTFGLVTSVASEIPSLDPARLQSREVDGYVYDSTGKRVLAVLRGSQSRILVPSPKISARMKIAIVAIEDKRFYEHRGVDIHGIVRAIWEDARNKAVVEGGSTITQQFVKNTYTNDQRSIARKLKEAALAWQLEQRWSKDRILTAYLNTIYFGNGAYGVQQAALTYFHHAADPKHLTWAEAALLAGIPSDPARYDPVTNPKAARQRRDIVLKAMYDQGDVTFREYARALNTPLPLPQDVHLSGKRGPAPYFTNYVEQQLIDRYGSGRVFGGGLRVKTTIDLNLQRLARQSITKWLTSPNGPSAALVAVDPRTGAVKAMIGGNNYRKSQFNLAVQGERQPGSSFKPFVLATALSDGISPDTDFESGPVDIPIGGKVWAVHNYENSDLGRISLATATTVSDNTVYAQLTQLVGPAGVARTARRLGITSPLKSYFAIGLGAEAVNPLEMARAFSAFANGGRRIDGAAFGNRPRAISVVRNANKRLVDNNLPVRRPVLTANTAALVTSLLESVIRSGTGKNAQLGRQAAGKTGTTENYGDAWFVGYTPQLVTAVWVGYPTTLKPMLTEYHGDPVAGGTFPALIWKTFMQRALNHLNEPPQDFPTVSMPYSVNRPVVERNGQLELDNGNCNNVREVLYFSNRRPARTADCKVNEVDVPRVVGSTIAQANARLAAQPLRPYYVYEPARPLQRLGVVLRQYPARGTLSSYQKVTLVLPKALHGAVPRLVGLRLGRAEAQLERLHLKWKVGGSPSKALRVVGQSPRWGVAAKHDLVVTLAVKGG